jgi:hypothetical protein
MDSIISQIAQLRASAENTLKIADEVAAAVAALAAPAVGAGLPPTKGAQGPLEPLPAAGAGGGAPAAAAALLPPLPGPLTAQLTLGIATPATFGDAEANAQHYLLGKSLYEPTAAQQRDAETKRFLETVARDAYATACGTAEQIEEAHERHMSATSARAQAEWAIHLAEEQAKRYQAYYDGTWASLPYGVAPVAHLCHKAFFIYRFFVFEKLDGNYTAASSWKPLGLLNPHAYNAMKAMGDSGKSFFLDFTELGQPAPDVLPYWRAKKGEEEDEEDEEEEEADEEEEGCCTRCGHDHEEDEEEARQFWAAREAAAAARYAALAQPVPFQPDRPVMPAMAYPTLERGEHEDIADAAPLGEKAQQFKSELKAQEAAGAWRDIGRWRSLEKAYHGGWTTLPDGRTAMLWAFHAFAPPPRPANYRKPCSLVHLGLYNAATRSLDATEAPPALPKRAKDWPWA